MYAGQQFTSTYGGGGGSSGPMYDYSRIREAIERMTGKQVRQIMDDHGRRQVHIQFSNGYSQIFDRMQIDDMVHQFEYQERERERNYERQRMDMAMQQQMQSYSYGKAGEPIRAGDVVEMDRNGMLYRAGYATKTYVGYDPGMLMHPGVARSPIDPCKSCGETHEKEKLDHHGFCKKKAEKFWGKVHRLYWHRHTKNKTD